MDQVEITELIRTSRSWDGAELPDYPKGKPELCGSDGITTT